MHNTKIFQVHFNMNFGETNCTLHALIKPTDNPQKFHVLRVQSLKTRENASVIDDFYIIKLTKDNVIMWVHAGSEISSPVVQSIGKAIEKHESTSLL